MFRIKICGIKDLPTAVECVRLGAGAIGLNFYEKSKRYVSVDAGCEIAAAVKGRIAVVGLFVNQTVERIREIVNAVQLDYLQFHGDESASILASLAASQEFENLKVIRAIRLGRENIDQAKSEMEDWALNDHSNRLASFILDTFQAGHYGGTGQAIDWSWLSSIEMPVSVPVILAGGLEPRNVAQAIEMVRPYGVDVAGGVENDENRKDPNLIKAFVQNTNFALNRIADHGS